MGIADKKRMTDYSASPYLVRTKEVIEQFGHLTLDWIVQPVDMLWVLSEILKFYIDLYPSWFLRCKKKKKKGKYDEMAKEMSTNRSQVNRILCSFPILE